MRLHSSLPCMKERPAHSAGSTELASDLQRWSPGSSRRSGMTAKIWEAELTDDIVEEALARLLAPFSAVPPEQVSLADAVGRVLAAAPRPAAPSRPSLCRRWTATRCAPRTCRRADELASSGVPAGAGYDGALSRARRPASSPARRCRTAPTRSSSRRTPRPATRSGPRGGAARPPCPPRRARLRAATLLRARPHADRATSRWPRR